MTEEIKQKTTAKKAVNKAPDTAVQTLKKPAPKKAVKAQAPKEEPKVEAKVDEPKVEKPKAAPKTPKAEPKVAPKSAPKAAAKAEPKAAPKKTAKKPEVEQKRKKKILFVAGEAKPYAASGGLGEVMGSLPKEIAKNEDYEISVVMPLYDVISDNLRAQMKFRGSIYVPLAWRNQYCGVFESKLNNVTFYFIDNEHYFKRSELYGYYDDGERFAFFSRAALEFLKVIEYKPDVIACNDWQTALTPIYYKLFYTNVQGFEDIRFTFTIHNIEYQGAFPLECASDVFGIGGDDLYKIEFNGYINLMKGAIDLSETISTVSPTYAQEILSDTYGHGLCEVLRRNAWKLRGILNGIDDSYNPKIDEALFQNFDSSSFIELKNKNKTALQAMLNLPVNPDIPMVGLISRLVAHKGMDIIKSVLDNFLKNDVQVVILGRGDSTYENFFLHMRAVYDKKVSAIITYNSDIARKIYGAADIFLMPSRSEPCGLSQMIACKYGAVPVVRETGGLYDSIKDCGDGKEFGNGFGFSGYNGDELAHALNRALFMYKDYRSIFNMVAKRAMETDFSWKVSANEYIKMFDEIIY